MAAITWRELTGAPDTGAFRAMTGASEAINNGFEALNKVVAQRQTANQVSYDRGQDAQSVAFREALAGATSEDRVKEIQAQRATMLAGLDPTRRAALVGAEDARTASIRTNATAARVFNDAEAEAAGRDAIAAAYASVVQSKDPAVAQAAINAIPANHPKRTQWIKEFGDAITGNIKSSSEMETARVSREATASNAAANTSNAAANTTNAATNQKNAATQEAAQRVTAQNSALQGLNTLESQRAALAAKLAEANRGTFGSDDGQKAYEAALKVGAGDKAPTIMRLAGEALASNPKFRGLPTDVVSQIVLSHSADIGTGKWMPDLNVSSRIAADLDKAMKDPSVQAQMLRVETARTTMGSQLQALNGASDVAMRKAYPEFGAALDAAAARAATQPASGPTPTPGAPAPVAQAAPNSGAPTEALARLAQVEVGMLNAGQIDELSPEVQKYLEDQAARDRAAVVAGAKASWGGAEKLGAAAADIFTLPVRAGMGIVNNAVRGVNTLGADLPYIPDSNGIISSMTPYSDMLARRDQPPQSAADTKALRDQLLKEVTGKKAK